MSDYWKNRFSRVEQSANDRSVAYVHELDRKYRTAVEEIDKQISSWYERFAVNNNITMSEARRLLTTSELKELKWDVQEYIKYGRENAISGAWMQELENASAKFHISRLEALKLNVQHQVEVLMGGMTDDIDSMLHEVYTDTFYRSMYELQRGTGIGFDVATLDTKKVSSILSKPWAADGSDFSARIWSNRQKLTNTLEQELSRMVLTGESPRKTIANIRKAFDTSNHAAKRLVMTEQAYFTSKAQEATFNELDVERFEVLSSMDRRVCPVCADNDKKVYTMQEFRIGITAPPFHPLCRCVTAPFFDDEFSQGTRFARGKDGKTYYVPNTMTYKEWKDTFRGGGNKNGFNRVVVTKSRKNYEGALYGSRNVTQEWLKNASNGQKEVSDVLEFEQDGVVYFVDGKYIKLDYKANEKRVAEAISEELGREVLMMPIVLKPQNVKTPDYIIDGMRFDLKSPVGKGKNVLFDMVKGQAKQADNFIFDITNCPLSNEDLVEQAERLFVSVHTKFIDTTILVKDGKVLSVFQRNK